MAKGREITCRFFFPDPEQPGEYKQLEELSEEERAEWSRKITNRMGKVFEDYFSRHPEVYAKF